MVSDANHKETGSDAAAVADVPEAASAAGLGSRSMMTGVVTTEDYVPQERRPSHLENMIQMNRASLAKFDTANLVQALDNLDAIAAVPGLDGLFVGPSDLSIALSNGAKIDRLGEATLNAMKKVVAACKKNDIKFLNSVYDRDVTMRIDEIDFFLVLAIPPCRHPDVHSW